MNDTERYNDIMGLPHHRSKKHPPMPEGDRAAQFSPFAALKGYDEEIEEAARFVEDRAETDEAHAVALNDTLNLLKAREREHPEVRIVFFKKDERKEGGEFITLVAQIQKIDESRHILHTEGAYIPFDDIVELEVL